MMAEEYELLRKSVREFTQKNIEAVSVKIEQEGLTPQTVSSMAAQGFIGARIPVEYGGSGLDEQGYLIVLEELARCSPSAAIRVLITNSLFAPLLLASGKSMGFLREVASGIANVTVAYAGLLEGHAHQVGISMMDSRAKGSLDYVLNADANAVITPANDPQSTLLLIKSGFRTAEEYPRLGFKGLSFAAVHVDSDDFEPLSQNGFKQIDTALNDMDLEVAAVSLGITGGALAKAIEYSKARSTFDHPLKDYQPIAFGLSLLRTEEEMLRDFAYGKNLTSAGKTMARVRGLALAKSATKQALQVHGGYGYFEDFNVEKFYRDAMALSILFGRGTKDMERLSESVYGSKAGFL